MSNRLPFDVRRPQARAAGAIGLLTSLLVLTSCLNGCTSTPDTTPSEPSTVEVSTTATPSSSVSPTTTAPASPSTTAAAGAVSRCTVSALRGSWDGGAGAAGTLYGYVALTNTGSSSCTLHGWPGISLVAGSKGTQVGAAARETTGPQNQHPVTVTLQPNTGARAEIGIATAQNYGSRCELQKANGFRVYPPGSYNALFVTATIDGCRNTTIKLLTVAPLEPTN